MSNLRRTPGGRAGKKAASPPEGPSHGTVGASILIIEDEDPVRSFLREALEGAGFAVVEACNGREGIELYRRAPTDLVITDIMMPEADGQEVIAELTWKRPAAKVLAITGDMTNPDLLDVAEMFGACRTLRKPFKRDQLIQAVKEVLETGT